MRYNKLYRSFINYCYFGIISLFAFIAIIPFISIIWTLLHLGLQQLTINFFTETVPKQIEVIWAYIGNETIPGGIANGILGTFYMMLIAIIIAVPLGILAGIYIYNHRESKFTLLLKYCVSLINGLPSILVGIIIYLWINQLLHNSHSALAGGLSLAIIMFPIIITQTKKALYQIPSGIIENGFSLGLNDTSVIIKIILPTAKNGIIAGVLSAISKTFGITTPLIITAWGASSINWDLIQPTSSITLLLWEFLNDSYMINFMWGTASLLLLLVFTLDGIAKYI